MVEFERDVTGAQRSYYLNEVNEDLFRSVLKRDDHEEQATQGMVIRSRGSHRCTEFGTHGGATS